MLKYFTLCLLVISAMAAAKPSLVAPLAYTAPLVATSPYTAAYTAPYYASPYAYPYAPYYDAYAAYPYSSWFLRK